MESRSKLPTMIKKPTVRAHVPSDRLVSNGTAPNKNASDKLGNTGHRAVLTSFENVLHNLRSGTNTVTRPAKRHASPELVAKKTMPIMAKRMRRSKSVSDIDSVLNAAQNSLLQKRGHAFAMPSGPAPRPTLRVPYAPPKKIAVAPKPKPALKRLGTTSAKPVTAIKKDDDVKPRPVSKPKIPPYDFKARFADLQEKHTVLKQKHERLKEQLGELETLLERYDECCAKLSNLEIEYKTVQNELQTLEQKSLADEKQIKQLNDELNVKIEECRAVTEAKNQVSNENIELKSKWSDLKEKYAEIESVSQTQQQSIEQLKLELKEAGEQLFNSNIERKDLHNTIMDLRGNIRVFCRVRPPLDSEVESGRAECNLQYNDECSLEISHNDKGKNKVIKHEFSFDQVFPPNTLQDEIFELVSPLVQSALDGYNVCIFAYGQTGSGKTFTMDGIETMPGIIPRTIDLLFDCFEQNRRFGWEFSLQAAALEIYNEVLYDLLSNESKDLDIRMVNAKTPTEIYVQNLTECVVNNKDELHKLMEVAKQNRATAATAGNERSSRSHAVTQLRIYGFHAGKNESTLSTINLIDLAGSESPKTSTRMDETKKINKSLSELTNVIMALLQKQDHVPYRNSKLTHLLMPSLGGNSKTLMFVNCSPFQDCFVESVKSLRFAASVNNCKMNKAKKNKMYNISPSGSNASTASA